jgi:hypothetical protein
MRCDGSSIVTKSDKEVFKDIKNNGYVFFTSANPLHLSMPSLRTLALAARYKRVSV